MKNNKSEPAKSAPRRKRIPADKAGFIMPEVRILDPGLARDYIRDRQRRGIDGHDEVWEGVYIVPPLANNEHQEIVGGLIGILFHVVTLEGRGKVYPGTNLSDRVEGWKKKFRAPDVVVALDDTKAVDCDTHYMGGLDFLVEVLSPREETDKKIPFYSQLQVREVLIIDRDTRQMRLLRHDGQALVAVAPSDFNGGKCLRSQVVPLAFRRRALKSGARTEVRRTDGTPGSWSV
jgi:Uma2 family endonuclease